MFQRAGIVMDGFDIQFMLWFVPSWLQCALAQKLISVFLICDYSKDVGQFTPLIIIKLALKMDQAFQPMEKTLTEAIESFIKIMTKDKNIDANLVDNNPLLQGLGKPQQRIRSYEQIRATDRIFAEFSDNIAMGSANLMKLKNKLTRKETIEEAETDHIKHEVD